MVSQLYFFETEEKHWTDSDRKDIDELMSNLFKSDSNSNLEYNLTTAHREYENYCREREYLKEKVEKDGLIFKAKIVEPFEEVEPFLNYEGFSSGNRTPDAIPESYSVESYNVANNRALLNALDEKNHLDCFHPLGQEDGSPLSSCPSLLKLGLQLQFFRRGLS